MTNAEYKQWLIEEILKYQASNQFTEEELCKKSVRVLEIIFDNFER